MNAKQGLSTFVAGAMALSPTFGLAMGNDNDKGHIDGHQVESISTSNRLLEATPMSATSDPNRFVRDDGVVLIIRNDGGHNVQTRNNEIISIGSGEPEVLRVINDILRENGLRLLNQEETAWLRGGPVQTQTQQTQGQNQTQQGNQTPVRPQQMRDVPIWYHPDYARYRNPSPRDVETNRYFVNTYQAFINEIRPRVTNTFQWTASPPPINPTLQAGSRKAMINGFAGETATANLPFSQEFWNHMVNNTNHGFGREDFLPAGAFFAGSQTIGIGLTSSDLGKEGEATVALHEMGRRFGLGSHATIYFRGAMGGEPTAGDGILLYDPFVERILERKIGRPALMEVLFWGNETIIRELVDEHFADLLGPNAYDTIQRARETHWLAAGNQSFIGNLNQNPQELARRFQNVTGVAPNTWNMGHIAQATQNAFNQDLSDAQRARYAQIARHNLIGLADIARDMNIRPYTAVREGRMPMRQMPIEIQIGAVQNAIVNLSMLQAVPIEGGLEYIAAADHYQSAGMHADNIRCMEEYLNYLFQQQEIQTLNEQFFTENDMNEPDPMQPHHNFTNIDAILKTEEETLENRPDKFFGRG